MGAEIGALGVDPTNETNLSTHQGPKHSHAVDDNLVIEAGIVDKQKNNIKSNIINSTKEAFGYLDGNLNGPHKPFTINEKGEVDMVKSASKDFGMKKYPNFKPGKIINANGLVEKNVIGRALKMNPSSMMISEERYFKRDAENLPTILVVKAKIKGNDNEITVNVTLDK